MKEVGLFDSVDSNDREGLFGKAYSSAKVLRILALIGLIFTIISVLLLVVGAGLLGGAVGSMAGQGAAGAVGFGAIVLVSSIIGVVIQALVFWYTGTLRDKLSQGVVPGLVLPYVFIVFAVLAVLSALRANGMLAKIIGIGLSGFQAYLWFVIISCVSKLSNSN